MSRPKRLSSVLIETNAHSTHSYQLVAAIPNNFVTPILQFVGGFTTLVVRLTFLPDATLYGVRFTAGLDPGLSQARIDLPAMLAAVAPQIGTHLAVTTNCCNAICAQTSTFGANGGDTSGEIFLETAGTLLVTIQNDNALAIINGIFQCNLSVGIASQITIP